MKTMLSGGNVIFFGHVRLHFFKIDTYDMFDFILLLLLFKNGSASGIGSSAYSCPPNLLPDWLIATKAEL